jgi:molybdopterin-guanine dinucleotide biosynthesis protein B
MKPAIFGLYGESNTGKTTLMVDIINKLTEEGFKIASVKISDKKLDIDSEGKDSWNHAKAGSKLVVLCSKNETDFLLKKREETDKIVEQISSIGNYDLILIEGAKENFIPKIRLGDIDIRDNTILTYSGNFKELIKLIKNEIYRRNYVKDMVIKVNGEPIPLTDFPTEFIKNTVCGMLKSLKGVNEIKDVEICFEM